MRQPIGVCNKKYTWASGSSRWFGHRNDPPSLKGPHSMNGRTVSYTTPACRYQGPRPSEQGEGRREIRRAQSPISKVQ